MRGASVLFVLAIGCNGNSPTGKSVGANDTKADSYAIDDPFDPASCDGDLVDAATLLGDGSQLVLGRYQLVTRTRTCDAVGEGCLDWDGHIEDANWDGSAGSAQIALVDGKAQVQLVPDPMRAEGYACSYPSYEDNAWELGLRCDGAACGEYYGSAGVRPLYWDNGWFQGRYECMAWPLEAEASQARPRQSALQFTARLTAHCLQILGDGAMDHEYPTTEGQAAALLRF
jgi:hypothetical protein